MELHLNDRMVECWHMLQGATNLGESQNIYDLHYIIDYLVQAVSDHYFQIPCQAGCSQCCKSNGLPRTMAAEWKHIHGYLSTEMPRETFLKVVDNNQTMHGEQIQLFVDEQERIQEPYVNKSVPPFGCTQCPFLIDDMCSIYSVRPAICRGYGYFSLRPAPHEQNPESKMFACQMAADTLVLSLRDSGIENMALPVWNVFGEKLYALNQGHGPVSTLPLWLFAHLENGELKELNLKPDFQALVGSGLVE